MQEQDFLYGRMGVEEGKVLPVEGSPETVWLVLCGDRGCVNGVGGVYLTKDKAEKRATSLQKACSVGLSYWDCQVDVEGEIKEPKLSD